MRPTILLSSIASVSVLALGACTTPQQQAQAPAAKPAAVAAAPGKAAQICTSRQVTGSLMPVHECHTAEEWAQIKREGQDSFSLEAQRHFVPGGN
jgi:hypothetical protein